jgi:hypothetical protein
MAYKPQLRAAIENIRLGGEAKIWNCESEKLSAILNSAFPNKKSNWDSLNNNGRSPGTFVPRLADNF